MRHPVDERGKSNELVFIKIRNEVIIMNISGFVKSIMFVYLFSHF